MYRSAKGVVARQFGLVIVVMVVTAAWYFLLQCQPVGRMSPGVVTWWTSLFAVSAFNIWMWRRMAGAHWRASGEIEPTIYGFQRWQLALSAAYVFGCAFRAIVPRADVQRLGLFDSWASSVLVGRSVATVAELCFAAQWALLLKMIAKQANSRIGITVSWVLVPLIVFAEICSWYGVLTTSYIGNAVEESTWALASLLLIVGLFVLRPRCHAAYRPLVAVSIVLGAAYFTFMCSVDIPMYASRWLADEASGREYLSLSQGFWDAGSRWIVTHSWDEWHPEIPWMSLYFSVGVWCSLALARAPQSETSESPAIGFNAVSTSA